MIARFFRIRRFSWHEPGKGFHIIPPGCADILAETSLAPQQGERPASEIFYEVASYETQPASHAQKPAIKCSLP